MNGGLLRVVRTHSGHGAAAGENGQLIRFLFTRKTEAPLPGDLVTLDSENRCIAIEPRTNEFGRGDRRGRFQAVAANLDRAMIVIAPEPAPSRDLLHRYLAACLIRDIEPVVIVNKTDLDMPDQPPFSELEGFRKLGYAILHTRCVPEPVIEPLRDSASHGISLLAGQSGVGKSTLLNSLIPDLDVQTRELSRVTGKGTHTTTSSTLHRLGDDAWLIDTPGVWEYGLWSMPSRTLERGFPEFRPYADHCHFRDCRHDSEPKCAVRAAVDSGALPAFRHQAWLRLLAEQERLGR